MSNNWHWVLKFINIISSGCKIYWSCLFAAYSNIPYFLFYQPVKYFIKLNILTKTTDNEYVWHIKCSWLKIRPKVKNCKIYLKIAKVCEHYTKYNLRDAWINIQPWSQIRKLERLCRLRIYCRCRARSTEYYLSRPKQKW